MKRIFALVVTLVAMATSFTSCDEENFKIITNIGNSSSSTGTEVISYDLWCDYSQATESQTVSWLFMRNDGTFSQYICSVGHDSSQDKSITCIIDSLTGYWSQLESTITLDIDVEGGRSDVLALTYDELDSDKLLFTQNGIQHVFERVAVQNTRSSSDVWQEVTTIFKSRQEFIIKLTLSTAAVMEHAYTTDAMDLLNQYIQRFHQN